jgi:hypothetical protein
MASDIHRGCEKVISGQQRKREETRATVGVLRGEVVGNPRLWVRRAPYREMAMLTDH